MLKPEQNDSKPMVEHVRSSSYQVHIASGGIASPMDGRVEISFFSDRVKYQREGLQSDPMDPTLMRANGQIEATPLREHVTGVSMSLEGLIGLKNMIDVVIADAQQQQQQQQRQ